MSYSKNKKIDDIILLAYKDRLKYNSNDIKTIFFSKERIYEYNINTHKFRPFNSVIWYPFNLESYDRFIQYLDNIIDIEINNFKDTRDNINIDIDNLKHDIITSKDGELINSFIKFLVFIDRMYKKNQKILEKTVQKQLCDIK